MAHDVFISYSNKDKTTADAICAALEVNGIRCWIAPRDILPGSDWGEAIIDAIHACRAMLLIFSSNSNTSPQIKREVERAVNAGIPVVPVRIEDVLPSKTLEYFISTQHWLDALTPPMEQHLQYLVTTMRAMLVQKPDGTEASVREPQLKPPPAVAPVTPPPVAAPPLVATPAAVSPARKFVWPLVIGLLVLAVGAGTVAGVLWRRGDRPAPMAVAVKPPEKPPAPAATPAPVPAPASPAAEPEDKTKAAQDYAKQSETAQDFQQKIGLISKAIDLAPTAEDKSRFYERRGEYYFQNKDNDKAIDDLTKALALIQPFELLPKHEIYEKRGLAYREKGDLEKARQDFQAALNDDYLKTRSDTYQAHLDKINAQLPAPPTAPPATPQAVTPPSPPPAPVTAAPGSAGTWPWTSQRLITEYDLQGLSLRDLELMRNEIYARHGWVFNRQDLRRYFEGQSWYRPKGGPANREEANRLATAEMSGLERRNVQIIQALENRIKR